MNASLAFPYSWPWFYEFTCQIIVKTSNYDCGFAYFSLLFFEFLLHLFWSSITHTYTLKVVMIFLWIDGFNTRCASFSLAIHLKLDFVCYYIHTSFFVLNVFMLCTFSVIRLSDLFSSLYCKFYLVDSVELGLALIFYCFYSLIWQLLSFN